MNIQKNILITLITLTLGGCSLGPTKEDVRNHQYGEPPSDTYLSSLVQDYLNRTLIDPDSAKYQCGSAKKGGVFDCDSLAGRSCGSYYGYIFLCSVNAKNRFGGYTGAQNFFFMYQNSPFSFWKIQASNSIKLAD